MDLQTFRDRCLRKVGHRYTIRERANGDCTLLRRGEGCQAYDIRPTQCRTFPFWEENVASPQAWSEMAADCPGMDKGRLFTQQEIEERVEEDKKGAPT